MITDTELLDFATRYGFGCWHDKLTNYWVSMAGCKFVTPRAALYAAYLKINKQNALT